jgi:hypothetical protein
VQILVQGVSIAGIYWGFGAIREQDKANDGKRNVAVARDRTPRQPAQVPMLNMPRRLR